MSALYVGLSGAQRRSFSLADRWRSSVHRDDSDKGMLTEAHKESLRPQPVPPRVCLEVVGEKCRVLTAFPAQAALIYEFLARGPEASHRS
jgi:hypothetical protein